MKVSELMERLRDMPPEATVYVVDTVVTGELSDRVYSAPHMLVTPTNFAPSYVVLYGHASDEYAHKAIDNDVRYTRERTWAHYPREMASLKVELAKYPDVKEPATGGNR